MDKEATIEKVLESDIPDGNAIFSKNELYACMDEYAKQDAIGFGNFIVGHKLDFQSAGRPGHWIGLDLQYRTTEELYSLYQQQIK